MTDKELALYEKGREIKEQIQRLTDTKNALNDESNRLELVVLNSNGVQISSSIRLVDKLKVRTQKEFNYYIDRKLVKLEAEFKAL